ncbi:lecithin retinol acyltransferase family protein [Photobacterium galatheae]|uniref:lecithin retinol acyltransferase family protein n=1 Tax=Photobacterium galatheae TaxID=1654360 RepID=UPI00202CEBF3|nr:lecithin retinol acyltransferase family protein [Photobacterium galatheae]MCM0147188.1 lecithin retinol acyltransferase family protein [Photobacterium galatheae]
MDFSTIKPGDVLVSNFTFGPFPYQHWSLVSDRKCPEGYYMLISASERTGTVREETVKLVTQGAQTYIADIRLQRPIEEVIANARKQIDIWKYSVTERNCEQFLNFVAGLGLTSGQVKAGAVFGAIGGTATALLSEKPTWFKILGMAVACAGVGVAASKATKKKEDE